MKTEPKQENFRPPHPKGPQYFEGILQLRNPTQEVVEYVWNEVDKKVNQHVYIQKAVRVNTGLDYYMTSNKFLKTLGKKLQERFGGELKFSAKLFSKDKQTSKELYRLTVMFRLPQFCVGEEVQFKGDKFLVKSIGKKVFLKSVKSGKKVIIGQKDLSKICKC